MWLIFLIKVLPITLEASPKGTSIATSQFATLVMLVMLVNLDLIINIWKRKNGREIRKRIKLNGRFENWKQISEALFQVQSGFLLDVWSLLFTDQIFENC